MKSHQGRFYGMFLMFLLAGTGEGTASGEQQCRDACSCYTFHKEKKTWEKGKEDCATRNGSLVVMETEEEWQFINSQIQNITISDTARDNEWYIGLTGRTTKEWDGYQGLDRQKKKREGWKWVNGKELTIDKWHSAQPSGDNKQGVKECVKMTAYYLDKRGLFDDISCRDQKSYICEYTNQGCQTTTQKTHTATTIKTTKPSTKAQPAQTTAKPVTTTAIPNHASSTQATTQNIPTSSPSKPHTTSRRPSFGVSSVGSTSQRTATPIRRGRVSTLTMTSEAATTTATQQSGETQSSKKPFQLVLIVIVICVVLVVCTCLVLTVWLWRRRGKDKRKQSSSTCTSSKRGEPSTEENNEITESSSSVAFRMVHNNLGKAQPGDSEYDAMGVENNKGRVSVTIETPLTTDTDETYPKPEVLYAAVVKNKKGNAKKTKVEEGQRKCTDGNEAVYAVVQKDKPQFSEPQLTYADLAEFNNSDSPQPIMPDPYQPCEYAVIVGTEKS